MIPFLIIWILRAHRFFNLHNFQYSCFNISSLQCNSVTTPILSILSYLYKKIAHLMPFFGKNVTFVASKLSARGRFIFCLWSMFTTFTHNFKNITQNGQNQSCDTIALKRRYIYISVYDSTAILLKEIKPHIPIYNQKLNMKTYSYSFLRY